MAKDIRELLEEIAVDMVLGSMEYMNPEDDAQAWDEVKTLSDTELVEFITA